MISQKYVVLDIEGTVCAISFVKDILFPYFLEALPSKLNDHFSSCPPPDLQPYIDAFPPTVRTSYDCLYAYIRDLTIADKKVSELKALQGYVWRKGYETGELQAPLFPDVYKAFDLWTGASSFEEGKRNIYIYSSGSVDAQILLFAHTEQGDLTGGIQGYFDTVSAGLKTEITSYVKIAEQIGNEVDPSEILFLSDNVKEITAAKEAGWEAYIVERPGNAPLSEEDRKAHKVIQNFESLI
ncbi:HAD-like domain-containing protein [Lipomyces orientalis]|uniref:HAD-like domain-containing protein n=1 Tax=Lipomyces orientalis TaxID=1233043 RepID=A0ACC3TV98_9ASCO